MEKNFLIQLTNQLYKLTLFFPKKEPLRYKMREIADDVLIFSLKINNFSSDKISSEFFSETKSSWQKEEYFWQILNNLEALDSFFEIAKAQNWVKREEILQIQNEYNKIKSELKKDNFLEKTLNLPFQSKENKEQKMEGDSEDIRELKPLSIIVKNHGSCQIQENFSQDRVKESFLPEKTNINLGKRHEKILEFLKEKGKAQVWQIKKIFPQISKRTLRRDFEFLLKKGLVERIGERNDTFYRLKITNNK